MHVTNLLNSFFSLLNFSMLIQTVFESVLKIYITQ